MLGEIGTLTVENQLLGWAKDGLPRKNALLEADARSIETAYQRRVSEAALPSADIATNSSQAEPSAPGLAKNAAAPLALPKEPLRKRSKSHLSFVRGQPCLICQQSPSDPHHLKFAQQRALGRKVSDEFTVPLCRPHHQDLLRHGNEKAWWANMQIAPMPIAKQLWDASQSGGQEGPPRYYLTPHTHQRPRGSQHECSLQYRSDRCTTRGVGLTIAPLLYCCRVNHTKNMS
jgi:hypothetical protein